MSVPAKHQQTVDEAISSLVSRAADPRGLTADDIRARVESVLAKYLFTDNTDAGEKEIREFIYEIRADEKSADLLRAAGVDTRDGTISSDGACALTSSRNYWYRNSSEFDADGNSIYYEDTGSFSDSMTASFRDGGITFSGSPFDAPDFGYGSNFWIAQ